MLLYGAHVVRAFAHALCPRCVEVQVRQYEFNDAVDPGAEWQHAANQEDLVLHLYRLWGVLKPGSFFGQYRCGAGGRLLRGARQQGGICPWVVGP